MNNKKGCTQTAYVGSWVTMLERWDDSNTTIFPNTCFFSSQTLLLPINQAARVVVLTANITLRRGVIWNLAAPREFLNFSGSFQIFQWVSNFFSGVWAKFQIPPLRSVMFAIECFALGHVENEMLWEINQFLELFWFSLKSHQFG